MRALPHAMIDAWNRGSAAGFAEPFTATADFIAFEGTHLRGRGRIVEFHQPLFATVLRGSRLHGEVKFAREVADGVAVMHAVAGTTLPGAARPSPSRDSMQLFVCVRDAEAWRIEASLNARLLTLERQRLLDDFTALSEAAQHEVLALIAQLR
jgi:uncharacterized protein (TIGR02246 family)